MSIHMFRVCVSESGFTESELESVIQTWVDNHTKWEGGNTTFSVRLIDPISDSDTEYYQGDFRFEKTDVKDNIPQKLTDKLDNKVSWYRVGYHSCSHDESDPSGCSWDSKSEYGNVPVYIPDME